MANETPSPADHRVMAVTANNATWELLDGRELSAFQRDDLLDRAHAAAYHWARAEGSGPVNAARASWLLSRAHVVVGNTAMALHHAERCAERTRAAERDPDTGLRDFDRAYAHEARARALALAGRHDEARAALAEARAVAVADDEDRALVVSDLASPPWFGLVDADG